VRSLSLSKKAFKEDNIESVCELDLRNQNLTALPDNIGSLVNLEILHLENNKLTGLPESIAYCKKLVRIHLDDNAFTVFP
jgi:Leucine-rich repeat (LRR) protein